MSIGASHPIRNKRTNLALEAQSLSLGNILPILHLLYMTLIVFFVYVHMNRSRFGILIPFSIIVTLSRIAHFLFTTPSCYSISIALHCVSTIIYTFVACYTFNCIYVDSYFSFTTTFASLMSFCTICASTKCCSSASSSFDSSMHARSINVAPSHVCSLTHQHCLLLRKN
jgi:hypothetical protein